MSTVGLNFAAIAGVPVEARVLLVDDEESAHRELGRYLAGLSVVDAYNVTQARLAIDTASFDVVVLDLGLPEGVGHQFIPLFRERNVEVIVHTVCPSVSATEASLTLGARHILEKTLEVAILLPSVISWILATRNTSLFPRETMEVVRISRLYNLGQQEARMVAYLAAAFGLTPRELAVLAVAVGGRDQRNIASRLGISHETVRKHGAFLKNRILASSQLDMIASAIRDCVVPNRPEEPARPTPTPTQTCPLPVTGTFRPVPSGR